MEVDWTRVPMPTNALSLVALKLTSDCHRKSGQTMGDRENNSKKRVEGTEVVFGIDGRCSHSKRLPCEEDQVIMC